MPTPNSFATITANSLLATALDKFQCIGFQTENELLNAIGAILADNNRQLTNLNIALSDQSSGKTISRGVAGNAFTSSNQSASAAPITDAPDMGKSLVITDIIISSDTALEIALIDEGSENLLTLFYVGANSTINIVTKGKFKLPEANSRLLLQTSAAGNITATVLYYSE